MLISIKTEIMKTAMTSSYNIYLDVQSFLIKKYAKGENMIGVHLHPLGLRIGHKKP